MNTNKHISKLSVPLLAASLCLGSCQRDFERINTDYRYPQESDLQLDGLKSGSFFSNFQKQIFPVGSSGTDYVNDYQIVHVLAGSAWVGYLAPTKNKWIGKGFPATLRPWSNAVNSVLAGRMLQSWAQLRSVKEDDPATYAVVQICKVLGVHKGVDTFGPIAYPKEGAEGQGLLSAYLSQEEIYRSMLQELDEAVEVLQRERHNVLPKYDLIYEGDYQKWMKLANSLMLRLATRIVYADPGTAKLYAEKAISNPGGVIDMASESAQLSRGAGIILKNPLTIINGAYNDSRMGAEMYSYLKGYNDPRIARYFKQAKQIVGGNEVTDYFAVRTILPEVSDYESQEKFSVLNVEDNTPVYALRASEVYFLRAEGAIRGWNMGGGTAEEYYNKGIIRSFEENGLTEAAAKTYLANETNRPVRYVDPINSQFSHDAPSDVTIKWSDDATEEKKLERIITQKYLALYPDGQEAWSEYRRTAYPKIFPAAQRFDEEASTLTGPNRLPYANKEYTENLENINKAVTLLGGADNAATRLWWDKKNK